MRVNFEYLISFEHHKTLIILDNVFCLQEGNQFNEVSKKQGFNLV